EGSTRAVYNDADIYLLDDPFSAVDAQTAAVLFNDCVMAALRNKTVILVVEFLSEIDTILVTDGGSITQIGSYTELLMSGTARQELVNAHRAAMTVVDPLSNENKGQQEDTDTLQAEEYNKCYSTQQKSEGEISALGLPGVQLTEEEEKGTGDLSLIILSIYSAHLGLKASKAFFYGFINSIFKAPMLFFDPTPVGRILTRASSDLSILDFDLPLSIGFVAAGSIELVAAIGVIAFCHLGSSHCSHSCKDSSNIHSAKQQTKAMKSKAKQKGGTAAKNVTEEPH
ncbi:hypothetical protein Gohar_026227, partial [Gossypium harknessii]|nr:hypothetical protein [Gossypium harknessii]